MNTTSNSPFAVAQRLLEDFLQEKLSSEEYLQALGRYAEHVRGWDRGLGELALPEEEQEESQVLLTGAKEGINKISQGVETLTRLATDKRVEIAEQGLQEIAEGQELLSQVKEITDQNISAAIDDAGYID